MKKTLFFLLLSSCLIAQAQYPTDKDPFLTKSLSTDNIQKVESETSGGSISVTGVPASQARVEVFVWTNNGRKAEVSKEELQKRLDEDYTLDISVAGNKLTATAKSKKRITDWTHSLSISFKIFVPQNISSNLRTSGGSIRLEKLNGTQDFVTSGGSLHVKELSGKINGRTSGGSIHVFDSKDDIDLTTSGGSIEAKNCRGNMSLVTSGGSLSLSDLDGNIKATTSGGSINGATISGELDAHTSGGSVVLNDLACSLETSTSGGHISVTIKELGKYVKVSNSGGNIDLQLPANKGLDLKLTGSKIKTATLNNFSGTLEEDRIEGKLNSGGIPVTVRGGSGRVSLTLK